MFDMIVVGAFLGFLIVPCIVATRSSRRESSESN